LKIPKKQNLSLNELESFKKEVEIMSTWFCPNINLFMGAVTKEFRKTTELTKEQVEGNIMIVSALMKGTYLLICL
jgi:archaellum component FlaC